jgi:hypothetical protein
VPRQVERPCIGTTPTRSRQLLAAGFPGHRGRVSGRGLSQCSRVAYVLDGSGCVTEVGIFPIQVCAQNSSRRAIDRIWPCLRAPLRLALAFGR